MTIEITENGDNHKLQWSKINKHWTAADTPFLAAAHTFVDGPYGH